MALSAEDIQNKTFDNKMRGYNQSEVNDFLAEIAKDFQDLTERNRELSEMVKANEEKLKYFTDLKDSLNKSILVAQEAADKVKNNAKKEAKITVREAQKQATDIVSEANEKANAVIEDCANSTRKLTTETNDLKKQTRIFRQRLQVMLESQLEVVKSSDWDDLLANGDLSDYSEIQKIMGNKVDNNGDSSVSSNVTDSVNTAAVDVQNNDDNGSAAGSDSGQTVVIFPDSNDADK